MFAAVWFCILTVPIHWWHIIECQNGDYAEAKHFGNWLASILQSNIISSTVSCDFQPLTAICDDLRVIYGVLGKDIVEEIESIMGASAGTEFTIVSLYSTEITRYRSWFLEYKLTRVNSVPACAPTMDSWYAPFPRVLKPNIYTSPTTF